MTEAERKILHSAAIIEDATDAIISNGLDGTILSWNPSAHRIFGYLPQEIIGKPITILHPEDRLFEEEHILARIMEGQKIVHFETKRLHKDGHAIPVELSISPIKDETGIIIGASKILRDLTFQKKMEVERAILASIVDSSDDCIVSKTLDGIITSWNQGAEKIFGYSAEEAIGKSINLIIPEDRRHEELEIISNIKRGIKVDHFETIRKGKNGRDILVSVTVSPIKNSKGEIIGASKIARDITLTRQAEIHQARLAAIVESSDDAIVSKTLDGIITSWNLSAEKIFGYSAREAVGSSINLIIPPDRLHEEVEIIEKITSGIKVDHFETVRRRKDGSAVEVSVTISPLRNSDGKVIGASKIARDISGVKESELHQAMLAAIVESTDDAIISKDLNGIINSWNHGAEKIFGYSAKEAIGQPISIIIPKERMSEEGEIIAQIKKGKKVSHFDTMRCRKDNTPVELSVTISPVRDSQGQIIGASKIARDIGQRKEVERALMIKNTELESLTNELNDFTYVISHDLKSPLRAIGSLAQMIGMDLGDKMSKEVRQHIDLMLDRVVRMNNHLEAIIAYSQAGRNIDIPVRFNLQEMVDKIIADLKPPEDIEIIVEKKAEIYFDRYALKQILRQLISNSVKFLDVKKGVIKIGYHSNDELHFWVTDNGPGIDSRYHEKVFKIFQVLNSRDEFESEGVGLAIVKKIVLLHGGKVWIENNPDRGITVHFTFPREDARIAPQAIFKGS